MSQASVWCGPALDCCLISSPTARRQPLPNGTLLTPHARCGTVNTTSGINHAPSRLHRHRPPRADAARASGARPKHQCRADGKPAWGAVAQPPAQDHSGSGGPRDLRTVRGQSSGVSLAKPLPKYGWADLSERWSWISRSWNASARMAAAASWTSAAACAPCCDMRANVFTKASTNTRSPIRQAGRWFDSSTSRKVGAGYEVKRGNRMLFSVWMCSITSSVSLRAPA